MIFPAPMEEANEEICCHKLRINAAELEQAVFLTLKKQMEAAACSCVFA